MTQTAHPGATPVVDEEGYDAAYARRTLITVIFGVVAYSSSMTIVSAVLPQIAKDLKTTTSTLSWAVTGLMLVSAVGTPIMGKLGDAVGRRRVYIVGLATTVIAMTGCLLAWNAGSFIFFRMLTGFGSACSFPNGMAMLINANPPARRAKAIGWFQMVMGGAPVFALVVGAWMTDLFGWRWVFALLLCFAVPGFVQAVIRLRDVGQSGQERSIDWWGAASLATGVLLLLLGLERVKHSSFTDRHALLLFASGVALLGVFFAIERRVVEPLLRLDYFTRRNFTGPLIAQPLAQFAYMGAMLIQSVMLQSEFGMTVGATSWVLLFRPGAYSAFSPVAGKFAARVGNRAIIAFGNIAIATSMVLFAVAAHTHAVWLVIVGLVVAGAGSGSATPAYSTSIASAVETEDLGVANGMSSTVGSMGTIAGIQIMFVVLGTGREAADFSRVFLMGAAVCLFGVVGALVVRPHRASA